MLGFEDKKLGKLLDQIGTELGGPEMPEVDEKEQTTCSQCGHRFWGL